MSKSPEQMARSLGIDVDNASSKSADDPKPKSATKKASAKNEPQNTVGGTSAALKSTKSAEPDKVPSPDISGAENAKKTRTISGAIRESEYAAWKAKADEYGFSLTGFIEAVLDVEVGLDTKEARLYKALTRR